MKPYYEDADAGITLHLGDCLDVLPTLPDASVDAIVCDPPYALPGGFMGKTWDQFDGREDAAFAYWLAGLIDGEGHFAIKAHTRGTHAPAFALKMRADELGTLKKIHRQLGIGSINVEEREPNSMAKWIVQDKAGCQRLVDLLDKYPLRAKKRMDYEVWREAVCEWSGRPRGNRWAGPADNTRMASLRKRLMDGRRYVEPPWSGHEFQDWCRLWAAECLRVLKPGGHLLAFGGTRTYHRMTCAIEDAGFEIRDSLHWIYGSGFPKGQDIAKSIDRRRDDRPKVLQVTSWLAAARDAAGWTNQQIDALWGFNGMAGHWTSQGKAASVPTPEQWDSLKEALGFDDTEIRQLVADLNARRGTLGEAWSQREVIGQGFRVRRESDVQVAALSDGAYDLTAPASDASQKWQGWNTALKPAHEPIVLARKSTGFNTTVANVLEHGTGALNIDACRTAAGQGYREKCASVVGIDSPRNGDTLGEWTGAREDSAHVAGRWPTNVLLTHQPILDDHGQPIGDACAGGCAPGCPVVAMDAQSGHRAAGASPAKRAGLGYMGGARGTIGERTELDSGGASRFFPVFRYEAKAPASERPRLPDGTAHTTVKPLALMRWLLRLVTPPGGLVLDPFAGSGTTLEAAVIEGFPATGIEQDEPHAELCVARLAKPIEPVLFGT